MSRKPRSTNKTGKPSQAAAPAVKDDPRVIAFLLLWFIVGAFLMFVGSALPDTIGLIMVTVEALVVLGLDRSGLYTMHGLVKVETLSSTQRTLLPIAEVIFFPVTLGVYLTRRIIEARDAVTQAPKR